MNPSTPHSFKVTSESEGERKDEMEKLVEVEGVVRFMRSKRDRGGEPPCRCCDGGPHIFARGIDCEPEPSIFKPLKKTKPDDWLYEALFRDDLEGRRVRVTMEVLPDA